MADTILGGDVTINALDDNRWKALYWSGAATGTVDMNDLYSACSDYTDEPATGDDATIMFADTAVEYTLGAIDANDKDPWYISYELMQHVTGGALRTAGWLHVNGSAVGIIVVPVTSNTIVAGTDYGKDISGATTGNGTLLEVIEQGTTDYLVIRPDTNAAGDQFTTDTQVITCNANTATQSGAVSNTGEQVFPNFYNVTPIDADAHAYIYQGLVSDATRARLEDINVSGQDYWAEGAFDRVLPLNDYKTANFDTIDDGYFTVFVRKGNTLYDSFEVLANTTTGGRNPVPLKAAPDGNQLTGYQSITQTASAGNWAVGDEVEGVTSGARGIITQIDNPGSTQTLHYYLIGDPQTTFNTAAENITNNDDTGTGTKDGSAPAAQGAALATWFTNNAFPSVAHGNTTFDIDDDGTAEGWAFDIDCNNNPLTEVYEWCKYITRNGETSTGNTDGIEGEQYVGCTVYLEYSGSVTGTIAEGENVTQETSLASGIVVSHDTTLKQIVLRDTRGTFATHATTETLDNGTGGTVEIDVAAETFGGTEVFTDAPLGRLAGGRWFGARGGLLSNWISGDENSFQLIDSQGNTRTRPIAISLSVSNLVGGAQTANDSDHVWMHRLLGAGLAIDKAEYSATGGEAIGATSLVVDTSITADTPGKTTGGKLNIRDQSDNNKHYVIRFSSWTGSTFTLANIDIAAADAATTTTIQETGAFTNAKRGDLVLNKTQSNAVSYIESVDDNDNITISPAITGQTTGDAIEINAIPVAINTLDDVYVSLIDKLAESSDESVSIVYVAPLHFRVKVANTRNAEKIRRFVTDDVTSGTNRNVATIRNVDTIHN